jgi:hypothetical protein
MKIKDRRSSSKFILFFIKLNGKRLHILFLFIFILPAVIHPQSIALGSKLNYKLSEDLNHLKLSIPSDSSTESIFGNIDTLLQAKPKLLPNKMSLMEKILWGENGLTRKIGLVDSLSPLEREHELSIRRTMLTTHQIAGFATLALMLTADYFGQKRIDGSRSAGDTHQALVAATIVSYSATALLAILSPPPLIRRSEESTTTLHKTLAWIHAAGMIITPIIGSMIGGRRRFNINKAHFHQILGYATTAIFASAMLVVTF